MTKPGKTADNKRFQKHTFAAIDAAAPASHRPPSPPHHPDFKSGLITTPTECPSFSEIGNMLSNEKSTAPSQHRGQAPIQGDSDPQTTETSASTSGNQVTPACIWEQFGAALQAFERKRSETFEQAAAETANLSLAISDKILEAPSGIDPAKFHDLVDAAWQQIKQEQVVHFRTSPQDLEILKQVVPDTALLEESGAGYVFHEDASLDNSTCKVEGPPLDIQSSLSKQLALIKQNFADCCQEPPVRGSMVQTAATDDPDRSRSGKPYKGMP